MTTPPLPPEDRTAPDQERGLSADQDYLMPNDLAPHLAADQLADLAVGALPVEASAAAADHLASCPACRARLEQVQADLELVSTELGTLAATAPPPMPVTVAARLDRVLAAASDARPAESTGSAGITGSRGSTGAGEASVTPLRSAPPLKAPATATYLKQTGSVRIMLAAAVAAVVVGFGGYVVSATAGLNEPSALSPTQVHPEALASQAESLAAARNLDPHLFSAAWRCARTVTAGRITGITPVFVNGEQNYLVFTRSGGTTYATLVSGCSDQIPTAGRPVPLTE